MGSDSPRVLATICARGGSKGIPNKNIRVVGGKPLLAHAINCAEACPSVDQIVISTDSDEIAAVAESYGVPVPFRRPAEMASDTAGKIHTIRHATRYVEETQDLTPDIVVDLDVGVPLRTAEDVTACVDVLVEHLELDAAVTVYESERNPYFNMVEFEGNRVRLVVQPRTGFVRRQDAPDVYSVSPSVFAFRRSRMDSVTHLFDGKWGACIIPRRRAVDIDTEIDLEFVDFLLSRDNGKVIDDI